jgi:hypothetical protein
MPPNPRVHEGIREIDVKYVLRYYLRNDDFSALTTSQQRGRLLASYVSVAELSSMVMI